LFLLFAWWRATRSGARRSPPPWPLESRAAGRAMVSPGGPGELGIVLLAVRDGAAVPAALAGFITARA